MICCNQQFFFLLLVSGFKNGLETEIHIITFTRFLNWKKLQILEAYFNFFRLRFWLMSF